MSNLTLEEQIYQKEQELAQLKQQLENSKKVWPLPEKGEYSWYQGDGYISKLSGIKDRDCRQALSEERATQLYKRALLDSRMNLWADTFAPDRSMSKGWVLHYYNSRPFVYHTREVNSGSIARVYLPTKELAEQMLEVFRDEIMEVYGD